MSATPTIMSNFHLPTDQAAKVRALQARPEHQNAMLKRGETYLKKAFSPFISTGQTVLLVSQIATANGTVETPEAGGFARAQIDAIYQAHKILTPEEKSQIEKAAIAQLGSSDDHIGQDLVLMVDYDNCGAALCSSSYMSVVTQDNDDVKKSRAKLQYFIDVALNLGYDSVTFQNASTRQHHGNDVLNQISNNHNGYITGSAIANFPEYVAALNLVHGEGKIKFSPLSVYDVMDRKAPGYYYRETNKLPRKSCEHDKSDMIQHLTRHYASERQKPVHCVFIDDYPKDMQAGQDKKLPGKLPDNIRLTTLKYDFFGVAQEGHAFPPASSDVREYVGATFATSRQTVSDASSTSSFDDREHARAGAGAGMSARAAAAQAQLATQAPTIERENAFNPDTLTAATRFVSGASNSGFWARVGQLFSRLGRFFCCFKSQAQTPLRQAGEVSQDSSHYVKLDSGRVATQ